MAIECAAGWFAEPVERPWVFAQGLRQLTSAGNDEAVAEIIDLFCHDTASRLDPLHSAVACREREEIRAQAHAIQGGAAQVGASGSAVVCRQIEGLAREAALAELRDLTSRLRIEFQAVSRLIETGNAWAIGR